MDVRGNQAWSETKDGMRIDWDVPIEMDDDLVLRGDVFRPEGDGRYPVILGATPYGKWLSFQDEVWGGQWKCYARMSLKFCTCRATSTRTMSLRIPNDSCPTVMPWCASTYVARDAHLGLWICCRFARRRIFINASNGRRASRGRAVVSGSVECRISR